MKGCLRRSKDIGNGNILPVVLQFYHYENLPMEYTEIFMAIKLQIFSRKKKKKIFFLTFAQCK